MQDKKEIKKERSGSSVIEFLSTLWGGREEANRRLVGAIGGVAFGLLYFVSPQNILMEKRSINRNISN